MRLFRRLTPTGLEYQVAWRYAHARFPMHSGHRLPRERAWRRCTFC
jgi:hypothetical protein